MSTFLPASPSPLLPRAASIAGLVMWAAIVALMPIAGAASAEDGYTYDLAREVMSPFCPGRTIASCPSPQAAALIQEIQTKERAGVTREEVEAELYAQYGDVIRAAPKPEGWGLAAYVIPVLAALAGVAVVALVLRRISSASGSRKPAPTAAVGSMAPTSTDDEIERLVDREIEQLG